MLGVRCLCLLHLKAPKQQGGVQSQSHLLLLKLNRILIACLRSMLTRRHKVYAKNAGCLTLVVIAAQIQSSCAWQKNSGTSFSHLPMRHNLNLQSQSSSIVSSCLRQCQMGLKLRGQCGLREKFLASPFLYYWIRVVLLPSSSRGDRQSLLHDFSSDSTSVSPGGQWVSHVLFLSDSGCFLVYSKACRLCPHSRFWNYNTMI